MLVGLARERARLRWLTAVLDRPWLVARPKRRPDRLGELLKRDTRLPTRASPGGARWATSCRIDFLELAVRPFDRVLCSHALLRHDLCRLAAGRPRPTRRTAGVDHVLERQHDRIVIPHCVL